MTIPEMKFKYLPPLMFHLDLPSDYPSEGQPDFQLSCSWLTSEQLAALCKVLDERAEEMLGMQIIFMWAEVLKSEAAEILGLGDTITLRANTPPADARANPLCINPMTTIFQLVLYNENRLQEIWSQENHLCNICFSEKPGMQFSRLGGCSHTFCKECVTNMAELYVREGTITELRCPDPSCRAEISHTALEEVLDDDAYDRWYQLKLQQVMATKLEGIVFCPRCEEMGNETPVMANKPDDPNEAPLAQCSRCDFAFCGKCSTVYHSNIADCVRPEEREAMKAQRKVQGKLSHAEMRKLAQATKGFSVDVVDSMALPKFDAMGDLTENWENANEGDRITAVYEVHKSKKGQEQLQGLWNRDDHLPDKLEIAMQTTHRPLKVRLRTPKERADERLRARKVMEELLTLRMLSKDSQNCPKCHVLITRSAGCNHMTCRSCGTHFCYKCGKELDPSDPYAHFREGGPCKTFDTEEVHRINQEQRRNPGMDDELMRLREEFGDQERLFAMFGTPAQRGATRNWNTRADGDSRCPSCGHYNKRAGTLNQVRCPFCRTSYCHYCSKRIIGSVSERYRGPRACPQHGTRDTNTNSTASASRNH